VALLTPSRLAQVAALAVLSASASTHALDLRVPGAAQMLCAHAADSRSTAPPWLRLPDCASEGSGASLVALAPDDGACDPAARSVAAISAREFALERAELLVRTHEVWVGTRDLEPGVWDEHAEVYVVPFVGAVPFGGGAFALDLVGSDGVLFEAGADAFDRVQHLWGLDALQARLVFELPLELFVDTPFCREGEDGTQVVYGRLLGAELVESLTGEVLASTRTEAAVAADVRWGPRRGGADPGAQPRVDVTSIDVVSGGAGAALDLEMVRWAIEVELLDCYLQGLASNSLLQGALVFELLVGVDESATPPRVSIDAVGSPELTDCSVDALSRLRWDAVCGAEPDLGTQIRTTVVFSR
jgi:hypothetical protein